MEMQIYVGGQNWIVDSNALLNWLSQNAVRANQTKEVVREVVDDKTSGRVLLNETRRID